jgi:hypothetical protein
MPAKIVPDDDDAKGPQIYWNRRETDQLYIRIEGCISCGQCAVKGMQVVHDKNCAVPAMFTALRHARTGELVEALIRHTQKFLGSQGLAGGQITMLQYRQGDVLLEKIDGLPEDAQRQTDDGRIVLAWGEQTGHAHALLTQYATRYQWKEDVLVDVREGAQLLHEEHSAITLEPGVYRKVQQREYTPQAIRDVKD